MTCPSADEERDSEYADAVATTSKPGKAYKALDSTISPRTVMKGHPSRPPIIHDPEESSLIQRRNGRRRPISVLDASRPLNRSQRRTIRDRPQDYDYGRFEDYEDDDEYYDPSYRARLYQRYDHRRSRDPYYGNERLPYIDCRDPGSKYDDDFYERLPYRRSGEDASTSKPWEMLARNDDEGMSFECKASCDKNPSPKQNNHKISRIQDLTKEERKEIMRLPWTHWMNSEFKNPTKSLTIPSTRLGC